MKFLVVCEVRKLWLKVLFLIDLFIRTTECNLCKEIICREEVIIVFCPRTILWENNLNLKLELQFQLQNSLLHS